MFHPGRASNASFYCAVWMASLLNVPCSTLPSSSPALFSCRTPASRPFRLLFRSNVTGRKYGDSNGVVLAAHGEDSHCQEGQSIMSSPNGNMTRKLGGIACGVFAVASVAWDLLPAFADQPPPVAAVTPYSKSSDQMKVGLVNGRIQACPLDINPNCVSTSSNNAGYAAPWIIPDSNTSSASKKIETAILSTQKNPVILRIEKTPDGGTYLVAEADGFLGRDVMEFLVRKDVVTYRSMARKVLYLYPFTTPIGDFDGQQRRLKTLEEELGWSIPSFENTYYDTEYE